MVWLAKFRLLVNDKVEVTHAGKTDPQAIASHAIAQQNKYDNVFCAIDRDTHETFDEAVRLIKPHRKVELKVSYPCFEYWLLLHFKYSRRAFRVAGKRSPGEQMVAELKKCQGMEDYAKGSEKSLFGALLGQLSTARKNASKSIAEAHADQEKNPSTSLHTLIDLFEQLSVPRAIK